MGCYPEIEYDFNNVVFERFLLAIKQFDTATLQHIADTNISNEPVVVYLDQIFNEEKKLKDLCNLKQVYIPEIQSREELYKRGKWQFHENYLLPLDTQNRLNQLELFLSIAIKCKREKLKDDDVCISFIDHTNNIEKENFNYQFYQLAFSVFGNKFLQQGHYNNLSLCERKKFDECARASLRDFQNREFWRILRMQKRFEILKPFTQYQDHNGNTLLYHAVQEGNMQAVELLLKLDSDPTVYNNKQDNPLLLAKRNDATFLEKIIDFNPASLVRRIFSSPEKIDNKNILRKKFEMMLLIINYFLDLYSRAVNTFNSANDSMKENNYQSALNAYIKLLDDCFTLKSMLHARDTEVNIPSEYNLEQKELYLNKMFSETYSQLAICYANLNNVLKAKEYIHLVSQYPYVEPFTYFELGKAENILVEKITHFKEKMTHCNNAIKQVHLGLKRGLAYRKNQIKKALEFHTEGKKLIDEFKQKKQDILREEVLQIIDDKNSITRITELLDLGLIVDTLDRTGNTLLYHACENKNQVLICLLIERGANVLLKNSEGFTPYDLLYKTDLKLLAKSRLNEYLIDAVLSDNINQVKSYLDLGAEINFEQELKEDQSFSLYTPLVAAAAKGNKEIYQYLLQNGAKPYLYDLYCHKSLRKAAENNHLEMVKYILKHTKVFQKELQDIINTITKLIKSKRFSDEKSNQKNEEEADLKQLNDEDINIKAKIIFALQQKIQDLNTQKDVRSESQTVFSTFPPPVSPEYTYYQSHLYPPLEQTQLDTYGSSFPQNQNGANFKLLNALRDLKSQNERLTEQNRIMSENLEKIIKENSSSSSSDDELNPLPSAPPFYEEPETDSTQQLSFSYYSRGFGYYQ